MNVKKQEQKILGYLAQAIGKEMIKHYKRVMEYKCYGCDLKLTDPVSSILYIAQCVSV